MDTVTVLKDVLDEMEAVRDKVVNNPPTDDGKFWTQYTWDMAIWILKSQMTFQYHLLDNMTDSLQRRIG